VRVVIADDEVLLREGLERLLTEAGFDVVGKVGTAEELRRKVDLARPDVAIVDIKMPPTYTDEGLVVANEIRESHHELGVLVLSHYLESRYAMRLILENPGGVGYLLKERAPTSRSLPTRSAVCATASVSSTRRSSRGSFNRARPESRLDELTEREREVLALMAEGRSNRGICERLFLSPKTVEAHVKHIFMKLDIDESGDDHRRVLAVLAFLRS
jgi:DNA-binding NarL/FixJ family response regulator